MGGERSSRKERRAQSAGISIQGNLARTNLNSAILKRFITETVSASSQSLIHEESAAHLRNKMWQHLNAMG